LNIPEYHRLCKTCGQVKHGSFFYPKIKNHCSECQIKKVRKSQSENNVKNVLPVTKGFNAYERDFPDKEKE